MNKKEILSYFKKGKLIQLILVILLAILYFILLITHDDLRYNIYSNKNIFILCGFVWFLLLFILINLFFDFYKLNYFNHEENNFQLKKLLDESNQILNRFSAESIFKSDEITQILPHVGCFMIEISNLKEINQSYDRQEGDTLIQTFTKILETVGNQFGIAIRNGGNEYLIIIAECTPSIIDQCLEHLQNEIVSYNRHAGSFQLHIKYITVLNSEKNFSSFSELLSFASQQLHA